MPRRPRIHFDGANYHVFSRGNRRERIFWNSQDYQTFETIMLDTMRRSNVSLFNWGLMPNHFHFNVQTPEGNLSEFIQRLQTRYAKAFNKAHRFIGHVFQGRYGARLVNPEEHFREIVRYVELNPYRLKKGKLAELGQWPWSSFRYYLLPRNQWPEGCEASFQAVLERFGNHPVTSRKNLAAFLADGLKNGTWEDFYKVKDGRFIGDEPFIEQMKAKANEPIRRTPREWRRTTTLGDLIDSTVAASGFTEKELSEPTQIRKFSRWRQALVYVARRFYRMPIVALGHVLGRDGSAISQILRRLRGREKTFAEIQLLLNQIKSSKTDTATVICHH